MMDEHDVERGGSVFLNFLTKTTKTPHIVHAFNLFLFFQKLCFQSLTLNFDFNVFRLVSVPVRNFMNAF